MTTTTARFDYTNYRLANIADCSCPDSDTSPGALLLEHVQDGVNEAIENGVDIASDISDIAFQIADAAPDVYTYQRWLEFVDLAAWQEDTDDYAPFEDLTQAAGIALYQIAERLAMRLLEEYTDGLEDQDPIVAEDEDDEEASYVLRGDGIEVD